jgi:hypothetical protein
MSITPARAHKGGDGVPGLAKGPTDLLRRVLDKLGPLKDPLLVFPILVIFALALLGDRIPAAFQWLVYVVVVVGTGGYLLLQIQDDPARDLRVERVEPDVLPSADARDAYLRSLRKAVLRRALASRSCA